MSHYLRATPIFKAARRVAAAQQNATVVECGYAPVNQFLMATTAFEALLTRRPRTGRMAAAKYFCSAQFFD